MPWLKDKTPSTSKRLNKHPCIPRMIYLSIYLLSIHSSIRPSIYLCFVYLDLGSIQRRFPVCWPHRSLPPSAHVCHSHQCRNITPTRMAQPITAHHISIPLGQASQDMAILGCFRNRKKRSQHCLCFIFRSYIFAQGFSSSASVRKRIHP